MTKKQIKTSIEIMKVKANINTKKRKITEAKLKKMKEEELMKEQNKFIFDYGG